MGRMTIQYKGSPAIWPLPNQCRWQDGSFQFPETLMLQCDIRFSGEAGLFLQGMAERGFSIGHGKENAAIRAHAVDDSRIGDEGYLLDVTPSGINLAANTSAGMFYAFQTLGQLIENAPDGRLPAVSIVDSPFKPMRGAHFYVPSRKNLPWFKRFLDFLAKYKYNTIFLEIGASMQFDSHPEINTKWESFCKEMLIYPGGPDSNYWGDNGMQMLTGNIKNSVHIENGGGSFITKAEMAQIAEWCRERHIEIVPEVQGLSHAYWMLLAHPECAERADDPYPDTWCPSNPRTYEIYFDCLQEVLDVLHPGMVSLGHDEYAWIGFCDRCKEKTGHDIFADDILKCHAWLKERGVQTHVWSDKFYNLVKMDETEIGMGSGGGKHLNFNLRTSTNELVKPTYRALDRMPDDVLISDWYSFVGPHTQDMFCDRGLKVLFGNFSPGGFIDHEARLRRPNVIGAEVSHWHETSDLGMSMVDNYAKYLDAVNILWHKGYSFRQCGEYNRVISQIYPAERDRMNAAEPPSASGLFRFIDISGAYNSPLKRQSDYSFMAGEESIPNAFPFDICHNVADRERDPACLVVGHGEPDSTALQVGGQFRSLAFLHSYTSVLAGPPAHACTYVGWEEEIVGSYTVHYSDGSSEKLLLEYSRNIFTNGSAYAFGAQRANPVYQHSVLSESSEALGMARKLILTETIYTIFGYEWVNPNPDKTIEKIVVHHDPAKRGGIVLFAVTGIE
jgi:hypothetical protein